MIKEIKLPSPGESINEVQISQWLKKDGDYVEKDEEIAEIDSDKATLTLSAEQSGILKILVKEGETVAVGTVACTIDGDAKAPEKKPAPVEKQKETAVEKPVAEKTAQAQKAPAKGGYASGVPSPAADKIMREQQVSAQEVKPTGKDGRITKADVLESMKQKDGSKTASPAPATATVMNGGRNERRER
jgi:2-oxoglutarate dehydrogenase E2 component (dihydrolipoamide succinyltransferase)